MYIRVQTYIPISSGQSSTPRANNPGKGHTHARANTNTVNITGVAEAFKDSNPSLAVVEERGQPWPAEHEDDEEGHSHRKPDRRRAVLASGGMEGEPLVRGLQCGGQERVGGESAADEVARPAGLPPQPDEFHGVMDDTTAQAAPPTPPAPDDSTAQAAAIGAGQSAHKVALLDDTPTAQAELTSRIEGLGGIRSSELHDP